MALTYLQYDVFTGEPLLGNQLAVFADARGLDPALMQRIALEMNFSESTFILPAGQAGTDVRMRIFTPAQELPMAGHPTIGSTFALAHQGVIRHGSSRFVFGLGIGPTPVDLEWGTEGLRFAWMTQRRPQFGPVIDARDAVADAIGLTRADLAPDLPIQPVSCGLHYLMVPLKDHERVDRAVSDASAALRLRAAIGVEPEIYLFSLSPAGSPQTAYARMFAPAVGIVEDPATGSAAGPLGSYLVQHGLLTGAAADRVVILQGAKMGRASWIHVSIDGAPNAIAQVKVGGEAVLVGRGELFI